MDNANDIIRLFNRVDGTIKNIAFTNYIANGWYGQNHAFFNILDGTLENVYLHVKSLTNTGNNPAAVALNVYSNANLKNVIIKNDCTSSVMQTMFGSGTFYSNAKFNNVYYIADSAICATPNSHANQYDTLKSWYTANNTSTLFNDSVWGVSRGYLTLGGNKLGLVTDPTSIGEVYYATTNAEAFNVTGFSGTAEEVIIDGTDVTSYCTLSTAGEISVASTAMSTLSNGEHTVSVATSQTLYSATLVVGTHVLSTSAEFVTFFTTTYIGATNVKNSVAANNATAKWYVVVANDITVNDSTYTGNGAFTYAGSDSCIFMGTFDGRGHVISNVNVQRSIFGWIRSATIKDVAFVNGKTTQGSNARQGFLAISSSAGTVIDNVYIQYTSAGTNDNSAGFISYCNSTAIKNCVVNVTFNTSTNDIIPSFVGGENFDGSSDRCSNFYAVSNITHSSTNSVVNLSLSVDAMIANFLSSDDSTYALPSGFNDYWSINSTTSEMKFGTATVYAGNEA